MTKITLLSFAISLVGSIMALEDVSSCLRSLFSYDDQKDPGPLKRSPGGFSISAPSVGFRVPLFMEGAYSLGIPGGSAVQERSLAPGLSRKDRRQGQCRLKSGDYMLL